MTAERATVEMTGITVDFPGQRALNGVSLRLFPGEVHSLMGENGAGKSTLIKVLTGAQPADAGRISLDGQDVAFSSPAEAQHAGIATVYQEVNLLPNLSVAENIMLGRESRTALGIHWGRTRARAAEALARLGLDLAPTSLLGEHSLATQQLVAVARAVSMDARVLVLDEPTSSLDQDEVTELFRIIRNLRDSGVAVLFISHFLEQVYEISSRITVLRNGETVGEYLTPELLRIDLVQKMIGRDVDSLESLSERRDVDAETPERPAAIVAEGLRRPGFDPVDLRIEEGEVLGFAGLLGSGRSEVARMLAGADRAAGGSIMIGGRRRRFSTPRSAIASRVVYASEDRKRDGIIGALTVRENIMLALQAQRGWLRPISRRRADELVQSYIEALRIRPADPDALVANLSGGNQQKVLLARWLALAPRVLVLDEPTRGIDVGAKIEIQRLVASLAENGMSLLFISAELDEVLRLSDRVAIMRDRRLVATAERGSLTAARVLAAISDVPDGDPLPSGRGVPG